MAFTLFSRRRPDATITALYGAIVAHARHPVFYAEYGVADTLEGRFDMIVLHLALLNRRLRAGSDALRQRAQATFDAFCTDMDHNLREMGFSDAGVPRRMRAFGEAFYGRAAAYDRALDAADVTALNAALGRNLWADEGYAGACRLAAYVQAAVQALAAQPEPELAHGQVHFPDPGLIDPEGSPAKSRA